MIGSAEAATHRGERRLARLGEARHRYLAIDGGGGGHLLAALAGHDPRLTPAPSPRHADLLIVVEPVGRALVPAVVEVARALPRPAHALLVGEPGPDRFPGADLVRLDELLSGARRVPQCSAGQVLATALAPGSWSELAVTGEPALPAATIPLPPKQEREIATELAVLSLGPFQPFTAGPLRLWLICDGEQVLSARVESGHAYRGVAQAMASVSWPAAATLARDLDPLAPVAGRLAYVRALEQIQGWQPPATMARLRDAALALERAQNYLWWLALFAQALAAAPLAARARRLATALSDLALDLWQQLPQEWMVPQGGAPAVRPAAAERLRRVAREVAVLRERVGRDRLLALRTCGIGVLATYQLTQAGVSGPVLQATERGAGDVHGRLLTRLDAAAADLRTAADGMTETGPGAPPRARWQVPPGEAEATVEGPRGRIGLRLVSEGGDGPAQVEWRRPSAALLALVPEALAWQKLADAEVVLASLDLATAEADG